MSYNVCRTKLASQAKPLLKDVSRIATLNGTLEQRGSLLIRASTSFLDDVRERLLDPLCDLSGAASEKLDHNPSEPVP